MAIGKFGRPHGSRGEVRLWAYNPESPLYEGTIKGWIESSEGRKKVRISQLRWADRFAIVKVQGSFAREHAAAYTNHELFVARDALPELEEDEFYLVDMIGWPALAPRHGELVRIGEIEGFLDAGAGEILRIQLDEDRGVLLAPLLDHVVTEMAPERARVLLADLDEWAPEGSVQKVFGDEDE